MAAAREPSALRASLGVAPKVQTTSAKNAGNGLLWARWSAFWAKLCRPWCVVRTQALCS